MQLPNNWEKNQYFEWVMHDPPRTSTHPDKSSREPAISILYLTEPPVLVWHIKHIDEISCSETQLLGIHRDVVP